MRLQQKWRLFSGPLSMTKKKQEKMGVSEEKGHDVCRPGKKALMYGHK